MVINFYLVVAKQPSLNTEKLNLKPVKNYNHASRYICHKLDILILLFSRESDYRIANVRLSVHQSITKTPQPLRIAPIDH